MWPANSGQAASFSPTRRPDWLGSRHSQCVRKTPMRSVMKRQSPQVRAAARAFVRLLRSMDAAP